jgi:phosphate:Na+ symporter
MAHLLFNVFGVLWVIIVFYPFVDMVCHIVGYDPSTAGQEKMLPVVLAMFHTCFNVSNTALLIGFVKYIEKAVCWILPDKPGQKEGSSLRYIKAHLVQTPELAVLQAQKETAYYGERVYKMFLTTRKLLFTTEKEEMQTLFEQVKSAEEYTDRTEEELASFLDKVSDDHLSSDTKMKIRQMLRSINELESIGDSCYSIAFTSMREDDDKVKQAFTPTQMSGIEKMADLCDNALSRMNLILSGRREDYSLEITYKIENQINQLRKQLKEENMQRVDNHEYPYALGASFADLIDEMEHLGDFVVNVVQARLEVNEGQ